MMTSQQTDCYGAPTTSPLSAMEGINDFCEGFVGYQKRSVNVLRTADENPDSALANIYAGMLWMFLERPEAPEKSLPYLQAAEQIADLNHRENGLLALLKAWQRYDFKMVRSISDTLISDYPQDLCLQKIAQYHAFNAADAKLMLHFAQKGLAANAHRAPIHSMLAFAHEQLHDLDNAEKAAHRALEIDRNEPWAHHALAHIHLGRGTVRDGLKILSDSAASWNDLNSFMFTHNWWHVALFDIAQGDLDNALTIYDQRCWGVEPEYSQDQIGAVSLLARLELAGADVGERWQKLRPYLETRADDVIQPFLSLQYLYGLSRAGSPVALELVDLIRLQAERSQVSQDAQLWQSVGIPLAEALLLFVEGQYREASDLIAPIRKDIYRIGGSHAQRDLFEQILLDARIKSGQWVAARKTLEHRRQWEPESPWILKNLEMINNAKPD